MFRRPPPLSHSDSIEGSQNHISAVEKIERPPHLAPHSSSPQFQVVIDLYECLRDEKKLEKRRGFLDTWFKVRSLSLMMPTSLFNVAFVEVAKECRTRHLSCNVPHSSTGQPNYDNKDQPDSLTQLNVPERS